MKVSFSLGSLYSMPLRSVLALVAEAGFEGIELLVAPEVLLRGPKRIKQIARAHDLDIHVVHRGLIPIPGWKENGPGMAKMVALARAVDAPLVVIHPPRGCTALDDSIATDFARTVDAAVRDAGDDVAIAIENISLKRPIDHRNPFCDLAELRRFAEGHGLRMTLDTSHAASFGFDVLDAFTHFRGRIENVHLSDYRPRPRWVDAVASNHFVQHQKPGDGVLPLEALLTGMAAEDYDGNISIEVGPIPMRAWWRPALRRHLRDMADFVIACRAEGRAPGAKGVGRGAGPADEL